MPLTIAVKNSDLAKDSPLSYAEEKAATDRIREFQSQLMGKEVQQGLSFQPKDISTIEKWLTHYKKMVAQRGASRFDGKERVQAEVEIRRLEQQIARKWGGRVPSWQEYWINQRTGGIRYLQLVTKIGELNRDKEYAEFMRRWKALRRRMEPDDPHADNVLHLFKS